MSLWLNVRYLFKSDKSKKREFVRYVGRVVCVNCESWMNDHTIYFNGGVCYACGYKSSVRCDTTNIAYKEYINWETCKYEYERYNNVSEKNLITNSNLKLDLSISKDKKENKK